MATHPTVADGDSFRTFWLRVREFAVPPTMIETAAARRAVGDWGGACAAAGLDVDFRLSDLSRSHGCELAARVRDDLRHLAPDLLRWHLPRIAPDGLLRPGLSSSLARYDGAARDGTGAVHLVVRTPPGWAQAGQRISLGLWGAAAGAGRHPQQRYRLDLHRHLWDVRRSGELLYRADAPSVELSNLPFGAAERCAVGRWAAEAELLLGDEGRGGRAVAVRLGSRRWLELQLTGSEMSVAVRPERGAGLPVLPDAATWVQPDLALLRAGAIRPDQLHPLVAAALAPGGESARPSAPTGSQLVDCQGERHRLGLVDGVLVPLDHGAAELRREQLLAALGGPPVPCLQAIERAHRQPGCLSEVRGRLDHGDYTGALAVVEELLGANAVLRDGELRDELDDAVARRIDHGLFRAGLADPLAGRGRPDRRRVRGGQSAHAVRKLLSR
ncbi:hypothetical protein C7C46_01090 [Streptomyces tateyamensis]|uniref:Uncharacterized protein n=1 Tax=Streptomyces tateyamensis TaxID=565073 RepID=A0A2V4NQX0_9ACTN|nr:hypothetical protein [Streptomyces tateyamensis]PYC88272.1 hypothetical protein C7C46_01090 [Streptomyces tateyamensis]